MIIGIGVDLIEVDRVVKACDKNAFTERTFTEAEIALIAANKRLAADNFAVKEAVSKVFGTGISGFLPVEIEVLRDDKGKPYVNLYGNAKKLADKLGIDRLHVSISNTREYANAFAIGEGKDVN